MPFHKIMKWVRRRKANPEPKPRTPNVISEYHECSVDTVSDKILFRTKRNNTYAIIGGFRAMHTHQKIIEAEVSELSGAKLIAIVTEEGTGKKHYLHTPIPTN